MSKVAISGNASGTGTFTIQAPNSNTDRVLSLPDEAGTVLTSASDVSLSQLPQASYASWKLSINTTITSDLVSLTILESNDLPESSGTFTVQTSGVYFITFCAGWGFDSSERQVEASIKINNVVVAQGREQVIDVESGNCFGSTTLNYVGALSAGDTIKFRHENSYSSNNAQMYADITHGSIALIGRGS